jgi:hypothetical protein
MLETAAQVSAVVIVVLMLPATIRDAHRIIRYLRRRTTR